MVLSSRGGIPQPSPPQTEEPRAHRPTGSHRHSPWHRAAPRARSLLVSLGSRTSPAPTPGNGAATRTHRGRIIGGEGSPVPQNPHRCGTRGASERNFGGRELTVRCGGARCGAVRDRCGTGAGAAAAPAPPGSRAAAPRSPAHCPQATPPPSESHAPLRSPPRPQRCARRGVPAAIRGAAGWEPPDPPPPRSSACAGCSQEPSVQPRGDVGGRKVGVTLGAWAGGVPCRMM